MMTREEDEKEVMRKDAHAIHINSGIRTHMTWNHSYPSLYTKKMSLSSYAHQSLFSNPPPSLFIIRHLTCTHSSLKLVISQTVIF